MLKEAEVAFAEAFTESLNQERQHETLVQSFQRANREVGLAYSVMFLKENEFSTNWSVRISSNPGADYLHLAGIEAISGRFDQVIQKGEPLLRLLAGAKDHTAKVLLVPIQSADHQDAMFAAIHQTEFDYHQINSAKYILSILYYEFADQKAIPLKNETFPSPLSTLEMKILRLRASGLDVDQIAEITERTSRKIESDLHVIVTKLKARDLVSAVAKAARYGIVE